MYVLIMISLHKFSFIFFGNSLTLKKNNIFLVTFFINI